MEIEDIKPNKPNFGLIVTLFAISILVIAAATIAFLTWRAKHETKAPFTKHPLSQLVQPAPPQETAA